MPQAPQSEQPLLSRSEVRPAFSASHVGGREAGRRAGPGIATQESGSKSPVAQKGDLQGPQPILCPRGNTLKKLRMACMGAVEVPDLSRPLPLTPVPPTSLYESLKEVLSVKGERPGLCRVGWSSHRVGKKGCPVTGAVWEGWDPREGVAGRQGVGCLGI